MNVRDILDVKAICEAGSLRKAAILRGVTQPTLSNRVAHLETQLGTTLFDRSRGQSRPTELALIIASRAGVIAEEAIRLTREVKRLAAGQGGLVRVGFAPGPMRIALPGIIAEIASRFPDIGLEIVSAPTVELTDQLRHGSVDLVVGPSAQPEHPDIASELLLETAIVVVTRPGHPLCHQAPVSAADVFKFPLAISVIERRYLDILKDNYGIDLDRQIGRVICPDFDTVIRAVCQSTQLITVVPRFAIAPELEAGRLQVVKFAVPFRHSIYMHTNRKAYPLPAVGQVIDVIQRAFVGIRAEEARLTGVTA